MTWRTLRYDYIDEFKRSWPCHGLPDNLHSISFGFFANGDVAAIEACDADGSPLDSANFDGPHLVVMADDAQQFGDESD